MKNSIRLDRSQRQQKYYYIASIIVIVILAFLFTFPLYWIITGAFKTKKEIMATEPVWFPSEWTMKNFENLMDKRSAPLFDFTIPALKIEAFGYVVFMKLFCILDFGFCFIQFNAIRIINLCNVRSVYVICGALGDYDVSACLRGVYVL